MKPYTQIVQIRGDERLITREEWSKLFQIKDTFDNDFEAAVNRKIKREIQI